MAPTKRERPKHRDLIRWDVHKDIRTLLSIVARSAEVGVKIPWDTVSKDIGPHVTGNAILQHLTKHRKKLEQGLPLYGTGSVHQKATRPSTARAAAFGTTTHTKPRPNAKARPNKKGNISKPVPRAAARPAIIEDSDDGEDIDVDNASDSDGSYGESMAKTKRSASTNSIEKTKEPAPPAQTPPSKPLATAKHAPNSVDQLAAIESVPVSSSKSKDTAIKREPSTDAGAQADDEAENDDLEGDNEYVGRGSRFFAYDRTPGIMPDEYFRRKAAEAQDHSGRASSLVSEDSHNIARSRHSSHSDDGFEVLTLKFADSDGLRVIEQRHQAKLAQQQHEAVSASDSRALAAVSSSGKSFSIKPKGPRKPTETSFTINMPTNKVPSIRLDSPMALDSDHKSLPPDLDQAQFNHAEAAFMDIDSSNEHKSALAAPRGLSPGKWDINDVGMSDDNATGQTSMFAGTDDFDRMLADPDFLPTVPDLRVGMSAAEHGRAPSAGADVPVAKPKTVTDFLQSTLTSCIDPQELETGHGMFSTEMEDVKSDEPTSQRPEVQFDFMDFVNDENLELGLDSSSINGHA